jgi:hypothetical protein
MSLKTRIHTLDEVPEELRHAYVERNGGFSLTIEGPAPEGYATGEDYAGVLQKQQEYRDRNHSLLSDAAGIAGVERAEDMKPVKELVDRYRSLDLDEYERLKSNAEKLATKGVKQPDDIRSIVLEAVEPLKVELETERAARQAAQRKSDQAQLRGEISTAFLDVGGQPKALEFITTQAEAVFEIVEGKLRARPGQYSKRDAGEPIKVAEWMDEQTRAVNFAFGQSGGGGATPSVGASPATNAAVLSDPSPEELGKHSKAISEGRMKIINS